MAKIEIEVTRKNAQAIKEYLSTLPEAEAKPLEEIVEIAVLEEFLIEKKAEVKAIDDELKILKKDKAK